MSDAAYAALVFFVLVPLVAIWVFCVINIVGRPDMKFWTKALWIIGILVLPIIGAVAFLIYLSKRGPVDETKEWEGRSAEEIEDAVFQSRPRSTIDGPGGRPPA
jgi:Phospholipase_D-nuclease N-terminal